MRFLVTSTPYPNVQEYHVGRSSATAVNTPVVRDAFLLVALWLHVRLPVRLTQSARPSTLEKALVRSSATTTMIVMVLDMATAVSIHT